MPKESRAHRAADELGFERCRYALPQQGPSLVHAAFDRPDGNPYDVCGLFVGELLKCHQHDHLP
jgi:hypothetical protein